MPDCLSLSPPTPELIARMRDDLAPLAPLPPGERLDGLLLDQSGRWLGGVRVAAEAYRVAAPDLTADDDTMLCLISGELRLRSEAGDRIEAAEYRTRFPEYADTVGRQIEVEAALLSSGLAESFGPGAMTGEFAPRPPEGGVPGFEIVREVGRGGMGVVYEARQLDLDRVVALKMILTGTRSTAASRDRFRREARNVARLEHPNIVPVYSFGESGGQLYFALKFIAGGTLADLIRDRQPWKAERAAGMVATLAAAVEYAHRQGIVHRDLKPANVLLDEAGTPYVADFGLARDVNAAGLTLDGAAVGTPAYMAPEQAAGRREAIGPHTDVFGLGAILFQLLTGRPPHRGPDPRETLRQAEQEPVPPVRQLNPDVPPALAKIVDRALAADGARRYPSAGEMEADLRRFLRSRRLWPWALGVAAAALLGVVAWNVGQARQHDGGTKPITSTEPNPLALPLYAEFTIRVWSADVPGRSGKAITEPGVLPMREGDVVRFDLNLTRPGHVYILWIDGRGKIDPFYPWDRKNPRALLEPAPLREPIGRVMMPAVGDEAFVTEGEDGLETVLVMVRSTPLPADVRLGELLGTVPPSPLRDVGEVALRGWDGAKELLPYNRDRGLAKETKKIDEPVLALIEKVRPHFDHVRAVRFAYKAGRGG